MKKILYLLPLLAIGFTSCSLDEENHSDTTQEFLATQQGFIMGLNSAYTAVRELYSAEEGMHGLMNPGTDEIKCGTGSNRTYDIAHYTSNYNTGNEYPRYLWEKSYPAINVLNFLINEGQDTPTGTVLTEAKKKQYTAEAKYLRAWFYFNLVQQFGDVTLQTVYNKKPSQAATRHNMIDVYDLIINDLTDASRDCSPSPQQNSLESGRASAAAARHLLARVYLTLGWVYDKDASNYPNDPHNKYYDAAKAKENFKKAYDAALALTNDASSLGLSLMPEYKEVFDERNDAPSGRNKEELFVVRMDWDMDNTFGARSTLNHYYVNGYEAYTGERNVNDGRCYSWNNPNKYTYDAFTMRDKDTRYNATFQTVWYATKAVNGGNVTYKINGVDETFAWKQTTVGDTAIYYPGYPMTAQAIRAKTQNRGGKNQYVILTPDAYEGSKIFPTIMKYLDRTRGNFNDNSDRSVIVYRLGETYLLGAEAAYKYGDNENAARLINIVRERARDKANSQSGALDIKATDVTLDYILEERTRELLAEHCRWADLARTGTLLKRVRKYDDNFGKGNIQDKHLLRPIPQQQLDRVVEGEKYPQNTGW